MNIIKKYLPEIGAVLVTVGLIIWGTIQTLRLQSSMNDTVRVTLAFEQYKVDQQAKMQQEQQRRIEAIEEVKNEANRHIQRIQIGADGARASVGILQHNSPIYVRPTTPPLPQSARQRMNESLCLPSCLTNAQRNIQKWQELLRKVEPEG